MSTNNKISNLINSQVPFFVRNDHQTFVRFLEAYYEYLEQDGKAVDRAKNLLSYQDIDTSVDQFTQELYNTFLKGIPEDIVADKNLLLKHIKDFYRARGTEKALRFLLNIVYGEQDVEFYYPKKDVLKVSDGKWYIQKSLRVSETSIDGTSNNSLFGLEKFIGLFVRGNTSGAVAAVERVDRFFEQGTQVDEIILTSIRGNFRNGETVFATFSEEGVNKSITSNVFGGILNVVTLTNPGSGYQVGQHPTIVNSTGTGGDIIIEEVSTGNVQSIIVVEGGSGYRVSDSVLITGGGGSGANANVFVVLDDSSVHPNTYNIVISLISSEANTNISNAIYSNLSNANANTRLVDALSTFVYSNTGPTRTVLVINKGDNYSSVPSLSVVANTRIRELGILGSMSIIDGGTGYANNDKIEFINVVGGYGSGGQANVVSVNGTGSIKTVKFIPVDGQITGGSGYSELFLPRANVITSTGTGANIAVTSILGTGAVLTSSNSTIGAIQRLGILSRGLNYSGTANVDFTDLGDGLATADVSILEGTYSYPGYYLNDDGHISGYNFLQDRDYYQNFSYVVKVKTSLERYRKVVKELLHPAGMKMFGQYTVVDESENVLYSSDADTSVLLKSYEKQYNKIGNTINVSYSSHGFYVGNTVFLEFMSGGYSNVKNGIYSITNTNSANHFEVVQPKSSVRSISIVEPGLGYNASHLVFSTENSKSANGSFTVNTSGSIVSVNITDYGFYYSSVPNVTAYGSNTSAASFSVTLNHYANTTNGNVKVALYI